MCDKVVSKDLFMIKNCSDKFKTQEICDKAVDSHLLTFKLVTDWIVTNKMIINDWYVFGDLNSDFATVFSRDIDLNSIAIDNINLADDDNFDYYDP